MKHSLLLLGVVAALAIGAPAYSQYIYLDVDHDGLGPGGVSTPACAGLTTGDVLSSGITSVDVWLDTNHNKDGSTATCVDGVNPLNMFGYDILLQFSGSGSVTFNSYTHNPALLNYGIISAFTVAGNAVGVGYSKASGTDGPGLLKLGTFNITVTGSPVLDFLTSSPDISIPSSVTGFGSQCSGTVLGNTIALGYDFLDACGTASGTPVESTTWGKIKQLYR